jgi:hypothetical protein
VSAVATPRQISNSYTDPKKQPDLGAKQRMIYCHCEGGPSGVTEEVISVDIEVGAEDLITRTERRCLRCGRLV